MAARLARLLVLIVFLCQPGGFLVLFNTKKNSSKAPLGADEIVFGFSS